MANIKSAEKRARQSVQRHERNRIVMASTRTSVKKARAAIESGDQETALVAVRKATNTLDRAAKSGVIHKNNASRRKSRITLAYNKAFA
jgi:small subunit ribosomal protein S20